MTEADRERRTIETEQTLQELDDAKSNLTTRAIILADDAVNGATGDRLHTRHIENYVAARNRYDAAYAALKTLADEHKASTK